MKQDGEVPNERRVLGRLQQCGAVCTGPYEAFTWSEKSWQLRNLNGRDCMHGRFAKCYDWRLLLRLLI